LELIKDLTASITDLCVENNTDGLGYYYSSEYGRGNKCEVRNCDVDSV
jgi:hypothetical protein